VSLNLDLFFTVLHVTSRLPCKSCGIDLGWFLRHPAIDIHWMVLVPTKEGQDYFG
jgi:hypothetical protein